MISKLTLFLLQGFVIVCTMLLPVGTALAAIVPDAPSVGARAYILSDFDSGRVLAEVNADERMQPASLTKIMTAYVVFEELKQENISMQDKVRVSEKAWRMGGSKMFIEVDTKVSIEDLLKGLIIQSGNDASVALAEFIAGDEGAFADLMNQYAVRLGMTGSHFVNSSGLPNPEHYTTARDTATLAAAMIRDFPELYKMHAIKEYEYNGIVQHNRNKLLWRDESVDGLKTGYTESAGYCLAASAERDQMRLISVVMGSETERSRARESIALLSYGFRFFETHRLYGALEPLTEVRIWKGEIEKLGIGLARDLYVTVPRGQYAMLDATMAIVSEVVAPVTKGEARGTLEVTLGGGWTLAQGQRPGSIAFSLTTTPRSGGPLSYGEVIG
jgi:D-alanyl-D-alanine carboxypeptidase (penicillin-binding protein 5/6)